MVAARGEPGPGTTSTIHVMNDDGTAVRPLVAVEALKLSLGEVIILLRNR